jgi:hypothetical protein
MRALFSTVLAWSCLLQSFACSSTAEAPSNGDPSVNTGGVFGVGGIAAVGGTQSAGGLGNGGIPAVGGSPPGSGGILVGNGGIANGSGGLLATGGFVNTGGFVDTGGFVGTGGTLPATGGAPPGTGGGSVGPYPAGPYGVAVGQTFPDIQLQGYVNDTAVGIANTKPFTNLYTMGDLRVSGKRYALIHNSEFL